MAGQAGALADPSPSAAARSSSKIRRAHPRRGPPSGPSFSGARQTAPRAQSFQVRADRYRRGQPLQRGRTPDLKKILMRLRRPSRRFASARLSSGRKCCSSTLGTNLWSCYKRDGNPKDIYLPRAHGNSPRPGYR